MLSEPQIRESGKQRSLVTERGLPSRQQTHPAALIQRARLGPGPLSPLDVLHLQRSGGDRAAAQLLEPVIQRVRVTTSKNVEIDIEEEGSWVVASLPGVGKVGEFEFADHDSGEWLYHMEVNEGHRRKGIGAALMRYCVANRDSFLVPTQENVEHHGEDGSELYLTEEGADLVNYCVEEGILPQAYCEPTEADDAQEYDEQEDGAHDDDEQEYG
ncbi:MAG TPA: hypothetical protein VM890_02225 [Longimicrobium sp.]|jgi:GNAT superfamily N-acetyltransferase|nr:hypothetical protein [Longimicrobium sp.]